MGIFSKLIEKLKNDSSKHGFTSQIEYNGIPIEIEFNIEESKRHLPDDYAVLQQAGIETVIKDKFIPWLKGGEFSDRDDSLIYDGIKPYYITYTYGKIVAEYSPTKSEDTFGQFEFSFESTNDYTSEIIESVAMEIYVLNGEIVKVDGFDI